MRLIRLGIFLATGLGLCSGVHVAQAAQAPARVQTKAAVNAQAPSGQDVVIAPKKMDGLELEAVETYVNPKLNEFAVGIGTYPFDGYYYGLSINGGYTYHFDHNLAWEVVNAAYYFSFQKSLTTELADRYTVTPTVINTLNYVMSTDIQYIFAYGKFSMFEEYIRYFRASAIGGLGIVNTTEASSFATVVGLKFQAFTRDSFSWNLEMRDNFAFTGTHNFMAFILGTGFSF